MRTVLSSTLAACASALTLAPATADAATAPHLKLAHNTSGFYQYDPSIEGTGPTYDAVVVKAQLRNCPAGYDRYWMTLVQDGVSYYVASTALGVGEFSCTGSTVMSLTLGFYGNGLHPGLAQATVTVYSWMAGMPELTESGTVRIPTGANNQP